MGEVAGGLVEAGAAVGLEGGEMDGDEAVAFDDAI